MHVASAGEVLGLGDSSVSASWRGGQNRPNRRHRGRGPV